MCSEAQKKNSKKKVNDFVEFSTRESFNLMTSLKYKKITFSKPLTLVRFDEHFLSIPLKISRAENF